MPDRSITGIRARAVVIEDGSIALIRRERANLPVYYVLPGGGVEDGETPESAAVREVREELGLDVRIERLVAIVKHESSEHYCFIATALGGVLGTGSGPEFTTPVTEHEGTYEAVWIPLDTIDEYNVWPRIVSSLVASRMAIEPFEVLVVTEPLAVE